MSNKQSGQPRRKKRISLSLPRKRYRAGSQMVLDGHLVQVEGQPKHVLVGYMAEAEQYPERAQEALRQLWNRWSQPLLFYAIRLSPQKLLIDHEQVVNEAFLAAFKNAANRVEQNRLLAIDEEKDQATAVWLCKIVRNKICDELRKKHFHTVPLEDIREDLLSHWNSKFTHHDSPVVSETKTEIAGLDGVRLQWVNDFLASLPPSDRNLLMVSYEYYDPISNNCLIPEYVKNNLRQELNLGESNLRTKRSRLVDALIIELVVRSLLRLGTNGQSADSIISACREVGFNEARMPKISLLVDKITAELRKRANLGGVGNESK